jgi:hypothetical protein
VSFSGTDDDVVVRNYRTGAGLERLTKGLGSKVRIEISEGMKRPVKHVQAAKLALECGLIARSHLPILPHFKEYKKDKILVKDFIGKVSVSNLLCYFEGVLSSLLHMFWSLILSLLCLLPL